MDEIIRGLFRSTHPESVKKQIFKKLRFSGTSSKLSNLTLEQRNKLLDVCFQYLLLGKDFDYEEAVLLLKDYLPYCVVECQVTFSSAFFGGLIDGNFAFKYSLSEELAALNGENKPKPSIYRRIVLFNLLLEQFITKSMTQQQHFIEIHVKSEAIRLMYESDNHQTAAELSRFLTRHVNCIPPSSRCFAMCSLSIHAMSDYFPKADNHKIISNYIQDITDIATLIQCIWVKQPGTLTPTLIEIFNIISATGPGVAEPSNALGFLVEFISSEMIEGVIHQIIQDSTISDRQMSTALIRMVKWIGWPNVKKAHIWVLTFFTQLANIQKFSLLIDVTLKTIKQLFICLRFPSARSSAMAVLYRMLTSFQHSAEAFHIIVPLIPEMLSIMKDKEDTASHNEHMLQLINLSYNMMQLHTGFPEIYGGLIVALKKYQKSPPKDLNIVGVYSSWTSKKTCDLQEHLLHGRSTETGKAGLVNLGNTCYINSVIQSLFMIDEFRQDILKLSAPATSIRGHLASTFAYLLLTNRIAYEPKNLVESSRPPWFASGGQQDCSEYLKYLLDCLKEEEHKNSSSKDKEVSNSYKNSSILVPSYPPSISTSQEKQAPSSSMSSRSSRLSTVEKLFHGTLKSSIQCSHCKFTSTREEAFVDFALPLNKPFDKAMLEQAHDVTSLQTAQRPKSGTTESSEMEVDVESKAFMDDPQERVERKPVQVEEEEEDVVSKRTHELSDLLHHSLADESLNGDNQYHCSQCNLLRDAIKTAIFIKLPKYLVLSLMRFTYNTVEQRRTKLLDNVTIAQQIQVPLHRDDSSRHLVSYSLCSVIVHSGTSADSGHYYSYARDGDSDRWCLFNDSHTSFASFRSIQELTSRFARDTAYVLIYSNNSNNFQSSVYASKLVRSTLLDEIEADNAAFAREMEEASKKASAMTSHPSNILGWDNDNNPPPPPTCGGGGDGFLSSNPPIC